MTANVRVKHTKKTAEYRVLELENALTALQGATRTYPYIPQSVRDQVYAALCVYMPPKRSDK